MEQQQHLVDQQHVKRAQQDTIVQVEQIKQRVEQENIERQLEEQKQEIVQHVQQEHIVRQM